MKVLELNKYYFLRGGTERYLFDVSDLLAKRGHEVIPFAMQSAENFPSPYAKYFSPHRETERLAFTMEGFRTAKNLLYSREAKTKLAELISATHPTVAHIHNAYHQLSSSVLDALYDAKVPTVMTIHDYRLLSPNYTLYHDGLVCERGMKSVWSVVPHRCIKHSYTASFLTALETQLVRSRKTYEKTVSRFLIPSRAAYTLFERAGWDMKKFVILPHFLDAKKYAPVFAPGRDVIYVGRLSVEKGIEVLIEAARKLPRVSFRIIGSGPDEARLKAIAHGLMNVKFSGRLDGDVLHTAISSAALVVVPSTWYEVFGYAALEAMALGKPVIASRIGALPELVQDGETGKLFSPGNADELAASITELLAHPEEMERMGRAARARIETEYTPEKHAAGLLEAFSDAMAHR